MQLHMANFYYSFFYDSIAIFKTQHYWYHGSSDSSQSISVLLAPPASDFFCKTSFAHCMILSKKKGMCKYSLQCCHLRCTLTLRITLKHYQPYKYKKFSLLSIFLLYPLHTTGYILSSILIVFQVISYMLSWHFYV